MSTEDIIATKLVANRLWSASDIAKIHYQHGENSDGKVLYTTGNRIAAQRRDALKEAILFVPGGQSILAEVVEVGDIATGLPKPEGFASPSVWAEDDKPFWLALKNLRWVTIGDGEYMNTADPAQDLVDLLGGRNSLTYVNRVS